MEDEITIKAVPVVAKQEHLICHCGEEMRHSGVILTSHPAQYPHTCTNMHATQPPHPNKAYPSIVFEEIEDA